MALGTFDDFEFGDDVVADHKEAEGEPAPPSSLSTASKVPVAELGEHSPEDTGFLFGVDFDSVINFD